MAVTPAPQATFIVPCYNQGSFLRDCVDSLIAQTEPRWEAIIVNDGSNDSGATARACDEQARRDARVSVLHLEGNLGRCLARNAGIEQARGIGLVPLDADDVLRPTFLSATLSALNSSPDVGIAYTHYERFGTRHGLLRGEVFNERRLYFRRYIWACCLMRADLVRAVGAYDDAYRDGNEDYDLILRLVEAGARGVFIPEPLVLYRSHEASWTSSQSVIDGRVTRTRNRILADHRAAFERHGAVVYFEADTLRREAELQAAAGQIESAWEKAWRAFKLVPKGPMIRTFRTLTVERLRYALVGPSRAPMG